MKYFVALVLTFLILRPAGAQVTVEGMKFGTGIESNQIVGETATFANSVDKVYCWIKVTGAEGKTLKMKWYCGDDMLSEVPVEITYNSMRTYSYKTIFGKGGDWRVDVVDDAGTVLQSGKFTVEGGTTTGTSTGTSAGGGSATAATIKIEDLKFGTGVENSEVVGEGASFPASTDKVYCWLKVTGGAGKSITVKWFYNGNPAGQVALDIAYDTMRTYAYKTIYGNKGEWKVDVTDDAGNILQSAGFSIQ